MNKLKINHKIEACTLKHNIVLILMGIFVFSPMSSDLALDYLHLPMSMPEIFALPFLLFLKEDIKKINIDKKLFFSLMGLLIILIVLGIVIGSFTAFAVISSARGYLWIFLFYCIFKSQSNPFSLEDLMYICLGSILGWLFSSLISVRSIIMSLLDNAITYGVLLSVPLFFSISFIKKKYILLFVGIAAIFIICVSAGIRRLIFISLFSAFIVCLLTILNRPRKIFGLSFIIVISASLIIAALPIVRGRMQDTSHLLYHRVFERSEIYMEGYQDDSDVGRMSQIVDLMGESWQYILPPRGFVSKQTGSDEGTGSFNDLPLKELFWTFSLPGALFILGHYLGRYFILYKRCRRLKDEESFVIVTYMTIMFVLLFLEGTFLGYPYATPITGACLGLADKKALIRKKI